MMDRIVPGGVTADIDAEGIAGILAEMDWLSKEFERLVVIYDENSSVEDPRPGHRILSSEKRGTSAWLVSWRVPAGLHLDCAYTILSLPITASASRPRAGPVMSCTRMG